VTPQAPLAGILRQVEQGVSLRLFLDYDGTLVPIARTPEQARPGAELLALLAELAARPRLRPAVLSGRPLASLQSLLPVAGLLLAGTYGLEVQWPDGQAAARVPLDGVRRIVEEVQAAWRALVNGRAGFMLEDKGAAIALHARFAAEDDAETVLPKARRIAEELAPTAGFRILGGHRFLEVAPQQAHKGRSLEWLLERWPAPGAGLAYPGDDDKDEEAFGVVLAHGGTPIVVGGRTPTQATARLAGPDEVRRFLEALAEAAE
jgi:trehalose 6-phosphate phosphatase